KGNAHLHAEHETGIYVLSGEGGMWYGDRLEHYLTCQAGDFLYIPAGVPHVPVNTSRSEPLVGLAARTDPNEQESVVLLPELDARVAELLGEEAAVFMPSGTMTQQIALRSWADRRGSRNVAMHPRNHLDQPELFGYRRLHDLEGVPVGEPDALLTLEQLQELAE